MLVAIIGESCTGKSTFADKLGSLLNAQQYAGKDYLRFAKNEADAKSLFYRKLSEAVTGENLIYVISEQEHLRLVPDGAVRILMTADLALIQQRFAVRMRGTLPPPVKGMLEKKHGMFDSVPCDYHIHNSENTEQICAAVVSRKEDSV